MFEILFKYPASLFQKGHFVFLTPWPAWLLGLAIVAAAGLLFWHISRNHGMLTGARPVAIWLLETAMIALILLLLWQPALSVATLKPQQNVVAVLVDNSRSMAIQDASGTREAASKELLKGGLLKSLSSRFQVRLYEFGKEPVRITDADKLTASAAASHIGDTLESILSESSSLPLGAVVLLSDGADNAGGIGLETISAIRRQRIPIHTVGFGRERPTRDVEISDVVVPARALPQSKLTASVSLRTLRIRPAQSKARASATAGRTLASQDVVLKADGEAQTETLVFDCGEAGPKTLEIGVEPLGGRRERSQQPGDAPGQRGNRKPRILYVEGEPRWEYKFIRRALDDFPNIELASMLRTTQNKLYRQGVQQNEKELEDGFPAKRGGSVSVSGADHRQRGGQLLHAHAAAADSGFCGPARRRAAIPRRARDALRWRLSELAAGGPGAQSCCRRQGHVPPRFHQRGSSPARAPEHHLPPGRRLRRAMPSAGRRCPDRGLSGSRASRNPAPPCC